MSGGILELDMSDKPNDKAFSVYSTSSVYQDELAVPIIEGDRVFASSTSILMKSTTPRATIRYTLDGTDPNGNSPVYSSPLKIEQTTNVRAAMFTDEHRTHPIDFQLKRRSTNLRTTGR